MLKSIKYAEAIPFLLHFIWESGGIEKKSNTLSVNAKREDDACTINFFFFTMGLKLLIFVSHCELLLIQVEQAEPKTTQNSG